MTSILRWLLAFLLAGAAFTTALAAVVVGGYFYVEPGLPEAAELRDVRLQVPMRIYTRDGRLMEQFGNPRTPVDYDDIPDLVIEALIAAEDDRFFQHPGIDLPGTAKAIVSFVLAGGERVPGGSTITQQVAREYFLNKRVDVVRKFREWILALRIESEFSKEEILKLFFDTFFYGQRSYGIVAAAQTYFGKELSELTLSEAAILAGIPQGPSINNPIYSAERAANRRAYVLRRMHELGYIDSAQREAALAEPITGERHGRRIELYAPYVAEMARLELERRFGPQANTFGLTVVTTLDSRQQAAAQAALRRGVTDYDERHGYRGAVARLSIAQGDDADGAGAVGVAGTEGAEGSEGSERSAVGAVAALTDEELRAVLADYRPVAGLEDAVVLSVAESSATVFTAARGRVEIGLDAVQWAAPFIDDDSTGARPSAVTDVLAAGEIVRFRELEDGTLRLAQLPQVQAAIVALDPQDGAIVALSGGFDYTFDKYNRAVQARRQPGSSFKPFIFSAALNNGFNVATLLLDAPITIDDPLLETAWRPENYTRQHYGWVPMRFVLKRSLNTATVRLLRDVGVPRTIRHLRGFGFDGSNALPANLSLALGAGSVSPLEMAVGYAAFANGGFRVEPYYIDRIEDAYGEVLYQAKPALACLECEQRELDRREALSETLVADAAELFPHVRIAPRAISAVNAYLVADMLREATGPEGTGARARRELGRADIGGKTGTTNDNRDAWFAGFQRGLVAVTWVGFNENRPLGSGEQGGRTALPMWAYFMNDALDGVPVEWVDEPPGLVTLRINPESGLRAYGSGPGTVMEIFEDGHIPDREPPPEFPLEVGPPGEPSSPPSSSSSSSETLF